MANIMEKAATRIDASSQVELGEQAHGIGGLDWKSLLLEIGAKILQGCISQGASGQQAHNNAIRIQRRQLGWRVALNRVERQVENEFEGRFGRGGFDKDDVSAAARVLVNAAAESQPAELQQFAAFVPNESVSELQLQIGKALETIQEQTGRMNAQELIPKSVSQKGKKKSR